MLTQFTQERFIHDIKERHRGKRLLFKNPPGYRQNDGEMVEAGQHLELQLPEKMTEVVVAKVVERKHRLLKLEYPVGASSTEEPMNTKWFLYTDPHLHHLGWHRDQKIWNGVELVQITGPVVEQDLRAVPREAFRVAKDHEMQHGAIMLLGDAQWNEFRFVHVSEDSSPDGCWFFLQHGFEKEKEANGEPAYFHIEDDRLYCGRFCLENTFPQKLPDADELASHPDFHDIETYKEFVIDTLYIDDANIVPEYGCGLERAYEEEARELEEDTNLNFLKVLTFDESGEPLQKAAQVDSRSRNALILKVSGENSDRYVHVLSPWLYPPTVDETFNFHYTDTERLVRRVALPPEPSPEVAVPEEAQVPQSSTELQDRQDSQQNEEGQESNQRVGPARRQSSRGRERNPIIPRTRARTPSTDGRRLRNQSRDGRQTQNPSSSTTQQDRGRSRARNRKQTPNSAHQPPIDSIAARTRSRSRSQHEPAVDSTRSRLTAINARGRAAPNSQSRAAPNSQSTPRPRGRPPKKRTGGPSAASVSGAGYTLHNWRQEQLSDEEDTSTTSTQNTNPVVAHQNLSSSSSDTTPQRRGKRQSRQTTQTVHVPREMTLDAPAARTRSRSSRREAEVYTVPARGRRPSSRSATTSTRRPRASKTSGANSRDQNATDSGESSSQPGTSDSGQPTVSNSLSTMRTSRSSKTSRQN